MWLTRYSRPSLSSSGFCFGCSVFAAGVYRGTHTGDAFALCIRTEFDYLDGCRWQSSQRIEGDATDGALALTYDETAITSDGDCFPPCTAEARIAVP